MHNTFITRALVGSRAHGIHKYTSDYDYKSVFFAPRQLFFDPWRTPQQTIGKDDDVAYEFQHFVRLACTGNPTVLEVLFSAAEGNLDEPREGVYDPELGKQLVAMRWKLLDSERIFNAHRGYASSQIAKLDKTDDPRRLRKSLTAYVRVMGMAIDFFQGKGYNVRVPEPRRTRLLDIRSMSDGAIREMNMQRVFAELERRLETAYELREQSFGVSEDAKERVRKLAERGYQR